MNLVKVGSGNAEQINKMHSESTNPANIKYGKGKWTHVIEDHGKEMILYLSIHDGWIEDQIAAGTIKHEKGGLMTINDWIDAEILRHTQTIEGDNGQKYEGLISTYAAAEIARGAALRIIADKPTLIQNLVTECHEASRRNGFYNDRKTGEPMERNVGELIALCHSELSEMLEAYRKDLDSKHIPGFTGETEECVDLIIRAFDLAGYRKLPIGTAYVAKRAYNDVREDHKNEARRLPGGKKF